MLISFTKHKMEPYPQQELLFKHYFQTLLAFESKLVNIQIKNRPNMKFVNKSCKYCHSKMTHIMYINQYYIYQKN